MAKKDEGISLPHAHVRGMAKATSKQRKKKLDENQLAAALVKKIASR
jgi:hypothetical protein